MQVPALQLGHFLYGKHDNISFDPVGKLVKLVSILVRYNVSYKRLRTRLDVYRSGRQATEQVNDSSATMMGKGHRSTVSTLHMACDVRG